MIRLRRMTAPEFSAYLEEAVPAFTEAKRLGEGLSQKWAGKVARESFARLLPEGFDSPNQFLFSVEEAASGRKIGSLWLARREESGRAFAYICDIVLDPAERGKGYGRQLMALAEAEARKMGLGSLRLHVFGYNQHARNLYEKTGFRPMNIVMEKNLD